MHALATLGRERTLRAQIFSAEGMSKGLVVPSLIVVVGKVGPRVFPRPMRDSTNGTGLSVFPVDSGSASDLAALLIQSAVSSIHDGTLLRPTMAEALEVTAARRSARRLRIMLDGEPTIASMPASITTRHAAVSIVTAEEPTPR